MWPFSLKASPQTIARKSASFLFGMPAYRGALNNATFNLLAQEGYCENAVAHACINKIATSIASIEPQLFSVDAKGKRTKIDSHPLLDLIESPNPTQSGKEFIRQLVSYYLAAGNAYVFGNGIDPSRTKGKPPTEL